VKFLFQIALAACLVFLHAGLANAQTPKPTPFDSYGVINMESVLARLDNFAIELRKRPDMLGFIVSYGPEGEGPGTGKHLLAITKDYLVNTRGLQPGQLQTVYAGQYKDATDVLTQLWIVPMGHAPPEPRRYKKLKLATGKFAEAEAWDGDSEGRHFYFGNLIVAALAEQLRNQPEGRAHIVAFSRRGSTPGAWRRVAKLEVADLEAKGIAADRISIHFGGAVKAQKEEDPQTVSLQYWIYPRDAVLPFKDAVPEKTPAEAVKIGSYRQYDLKYPMSERAVFEGFADVLRADEQLRVCIIVYADLGTEELLPDEPPAIDTKELVKRWKAELREKFGISESRIFVIEAGAEEDSLSAIDVWVVPPGVGMPDPHPPQARSDDEEPS
jgi:hypothetical protein